MTTRPNANDTNSSVPESRHAVTTTKTTGTVTVRTTTRGPTPQPPAEGSAHPGPWHVGATVDCTLWDANGEYVGRVHNYATASRIVAAVNAQQTQASQGAGPQFCSVCGHPMSAHKAVDALYWSCDDQACHWRNGCRHLARHEETPASQGADPMHPDGRCRCGGEGSCDWCKRHPEMLGESPVTPSPAEPARCSVLLTCRETTQQSECGEVAVEMINGIAMCAEHRLEWETEELVEERAPLPSSPAEPGLLLAPGPEPTLHSGQTFTSSLRAPVTPSRAARPRTCRICGKWLVNAHAMQPDSRCVSLPACRMDHCCRGCCKHDAGSSAASPAEPEEPPDRKLHYVPFNLSGLLQVVRTLSAEEQASVVRTCTRLSVAEPEEPSDKELGRLLFERCIEVCPGPEWEDLSESRRTDYRLRALSFVHMGIKRGYLRAQAESAAKIRALEGERDDVARLNEAYRRACEQTQRANESLAARLTAAESRAEKAERERDDALRRVAELGGKP